MGVSECAIIVGTGLGSIEGATAACSFVTALGATDELCLTFAFELLLLGDDGTLLG